MAPFILRRSLICAALAAIVWMASIGAAFAIGPFTITAPALSEPDPAGLLGWWKLDDGSGEAAADSSGSGNDGTLTNGPSWSADKPAGLEASTGSLSFDGANDYVSAGSGISLVGQSWTISFWARRASTGAYHYAIALGASTSTNQSLHIGFRNTNTFACAFYSNDLDTPVYTDTDWHHWTCTYNADAGARRIYRNGVLVASQPWGVAAFQGTGAFEIGRTGWGSGYFQGNIDDVRIYGNSLSASDVAALAAANPHGTISPAGSSTVDTGGSLSYDITPDTGYHVADVLVDGVSVGAVAGYTFENVTANHTIRATFAIDTVPGAPTGVNATAGNAQAMVSFTPPASDGGSAITSYTATSSPDGVTATGAASPLTVNGLTNGTAYTFTVTASNLVGTGLPSAPSNSVTPLADTRLDQTITFSDLPAKTYGDAPFTLDATAGSGLAVTYTSSDPAVATVSGNTVTILGPGASTITASQAGNESYNPAPDVARTLTVLIPVTASAGENGSLDGSTPSLRAVEVGATTSFIFNVNAGYHIASVSGCGGADYTNESSSVSTYTYTTGAITGECTVSATFALNRYTVTASAGAGGSLDGSTPSPQTLDHGSTTSFTFNADTGYHVTSVSGCYGTAYSNTSNAVLTYTYTTGAITGNCTVSATFGINAPPVFTGSPAISGAAALGNTLSLVDTGTSDPNGDTVTMTYQWYADEVVIDGATSSTYLVTTTEIDKTITCTITADDGHGGTAEATTPGVFGYPAWAPAVGNIDPNNKFAWSENVGWINFRPGNGGVTVYADHLEGYAWGENIGWIKLGSHTGGGVHTYGNTDAANWGVNRTGSALSGYAWSETAGWINFAPTHGGVSIHSGTGKLDGYAWGENIGWIHFKNESIPYMVVCASPTQVELVGFHGTVLSDHVLLAWETASEINTAGFHIRRMDSVSGQYERITATLIPATGSASSGASYTYEDRSIVAGKTYIYILEEMDDAGAIQPFTEFAFELTVSQGGGSVPLPNLVPGDNHVITLNTTVPAGTTITGNTVAAGVTVINNGAMNDCLNNGLITGGFLGGAIVNTGTVNNVTLASGATLDGGLLTGSISAPGEGAMVINAVIDAESLTNVIIGAGCRLTANTAQNNPELNLTAAVTGPDGVVDPQSPILVDSDGNTLTLAQLIQDAIGDALEDASCNAVSDESGNTIISAGNLGNAVLPAMVSSVFTTAEADGVSFTASGELRIVRSRIAITLAPASADHRSFAAVLTAAGAGFTEDADRVVTVSLAGEARMVFRFDAFALRPASATFLAAAGPGFSLTWDTDDPATWCLTITYPDGTTQNMPPFIHALGGFRSLAEEAGAEYRITPATGVIEVFAAGQPVFKGRPDYMLTEPGAAGLGFETAGDVNHDGLEDLYLITPSGRQVIYSLPMD